MDTRIFIKLFAPGIVFLGVIGGIMASNWKDASQGVHARDLQDRARTIYVAATKAGFPADFAPDGVAHTGSEYLKMLREGGEFTHGQMDYVHIEDFFVYGIAGSDIPDDVFLTSANYEKGGKPTDSPLLGHNHVFVLMRDGTSFITEPGGEGWDKLQKGIRAERLRN